MAIIGGTDNDDVIVGTNENDLLIAEGGNDTLIGGLGNDDLFGGAGVDIAVFAGVRAEFDVSVYSRSQFESAVVQSATQGRNDVREIEILRFDDGDYVLSALLDDFGETPETAGSFEDISEFGGQFFQTDGIIGFAGDRDLFLAQLSPSTLYRLTVLDSRYEGKYGVTVRDADGNVLAELNDPKDGIVEFETTSAGDYHITVTSFEGGKGQYVLVMTDLALVGSDADDALRGTAGDDTLFPGAGRDIVDGQEGIDTVVLDGNRSDFVVDFDRNIRSAPDGSVVVTIDPDDPDQRKNLTDVEIIRFDDQDIYVLDEIDDFGSTAQTAGRFRAENEFYEEELTAKGRIDAIGDTDLFSVELEGGRIYRFDFLNRGGERFEVRSVTGPDGRTTPMREFPLQFNFYKDHSFIRTTEPGTYFFNVAGHDEVVGSYSLLLLEHRTVGTDDRDSFELSPFNDVIDAAGGGDFLSGHIYGENEFDGGAGDDTVRLLADEGDYDISVVDGGAVKIETSTGSLVVSNIEDLSIREDDAVYTIELDQLRAGVGLIPEELETVFRLVPRNEREISGGQTHDIYQGTFANDIIEDSGGTNVVYAGNGDDKVGLLSGTNIVEGGNGADLIIGGFGSDDLSGGDGDDAIRGDISANIFGSDTLNGGEGDDLLEGGGGQDTFVFKPSHGTDTIGALDIDYDAPAASVVTGADFEAGLDKVQLDGFGYVSAEEALGKVTDVDGVATFSDQDTVITFAGLTIADLSPDDFIIV